MIDLDVLITGGVGVVTTCVSWFLGRRKYNEEVNNDRINNLTKIIDEEREARTLDKQDYKDKLNDQKKYYEEKLETQKQDYEEKLRNLKEENEILKEKIRSNEVEIDSLRKEFTHFKQYLLDNNGHSSKKNSKKN